MGFDFTNALGIHDNALKLRSQRAEVIGNNLANADTPGFQARDVDFQALLEKAEMASSSTAASNSGEAALAKGHIPVESAGEMSTEDLLYRVPLQTALDGNTVDAHTEKQRFMNNALRYNAELTFLNSRINGLLSAIRGE